MRLTARRIGIVLAAFSSAPEANCAFAQAVIASPSKGDPAAGFAIKLWLDGCVFGGAGPEKLRAFAVSKRFAEIADHSQREHFTGAGPDGAAWAVPTPVGKFAIVTRATTKACVVYAQKASPTDVQANFTTILEGVRRPGLTVDKTNDETTSPPQGAHHMIAYSVRVTGQKSGLFYMLATEENPGGQYQAMLEEVPFSDNGR